MTAYIFPQHNAVPCHGFGLSGSDRQTLMLGADAMPMAIMLTLN